MPRRSAYLRVMLKRTKFVLAGVAGLLGLALMHGISAAENVVVVELFTSQGCSSCPPADEMLSELAGRDDVIALSLHVDYWDYLGWRDTFGQRAFGERQAAYRDVWHKTYVYTPQMVVHGLRDVSGGRRGDFESVIAEAQRGDAPVSVTIEPKAGMLMCRIEATGQPAAGTIWIAKYALRETVAIERGENAGRTITYVNVVRSLDRMGEWDGSEVEDVTMPQPNPGEGVAIWVQDGNAGPILAAAKVENPAN